MASDQSHDFGVVSEILENILQAAVEAVAVDDGQTSRNAPDENASASSNCHTEDSSPETAKPVMNDAEQVGNKAAQNSLQHATIMEDACENEASSPQNLENAPNFTLNPNDMRKQGTGRGMDSMLSAASSLPHQGSTMELEDSVRCAVRMALDQAVEAAAIKLAAMTSSHNGPSAPKNTQNSSSKEHDNPDSGVQQVDTESAGTDNQKKVRKHPGRIRNACIHTCMCKRR